MPEVVDAMENLVHEEYENAGLPNSDYDPQKNHRQYLHGPARGGPWGRALGGGPHALGEPGGRQNVEQLTLYCNL